MTPGEPTASTERMIRELMIVERPEGTHLSQASTSDGYSALARDDRTNELTTHARLYPVGEDETGLQPDPLPVLGLGAEEYESDALAETPSAMQMLVGALVIVGALEAGRRLAPHAKRWWDELALPTAVTSTWHKVVRARGTDDSPATDESPSPPSQEQVVLLAEPDISMSGTEARDRLAAALLARLFSDEQLRILRSARIEDEDGLLQVERALRTFTPEQVEGALKSVLEANPSLVHEDVAAELESILRSGRLDGRVLQAPLGITGDLATRASETATTTRPPTS